MSESRYLSWIEKADKDLLVAEHEMKYGEEMVREAVCFHCQQAVEKNLKAFLLFHKVEFPRTHSIEYLLDECSKLCSDFKSFDFKDLSYFAVQGRYPEIEKFEPTQAEVQNYVVIAQRVEKVVKSKVMFHN